jgi:PAS domain S-box-containing protein
VTRHLVSVPVTISVRVIVHASLKALRDSPEDRVVDSSSPSALAGVDLLFSTTGDAVLAVDAETGVLLRANESLETITGMSLASLVDNDVSLLSPAPPLREVAFDRTLLEHPGLYQEVRIRHVDGHHVIVTVRVTHVELVERRVVLCVVRDETERRLLERELITKHVALLRAHQDLEARKREVMALSEQLTDVSRAAMLGEVVAEVAHALNNPLGALISSLRTLRRLTEGLEPEERARFARALDRCQQLGERMARVVEDLRLTCRDARTDPVDGACDLAEQAQSALALLEHRIAPNVEVELHAEEPVVARVPGDELHHAIVNLVDNALHAVGDRGRIHVVAEARGGRAVLRVSDDGPGFAPELSERIFEPFFSTRPQKRGSGVGLSMVRRMAHRYGGRVEASARGPLGGASFVIELPGGA